MSTLDRWRKKASGDPKDLPPADKAKLAALAKARAQLMIPLFTHDLTTHMPALRKSRRIQTHMAPSYARKIWRGTSERQTTTSEKPKKT